MAPAVRTSADDEHTTGVIMALVWGFARWARWGRVTTSPCWARRLAGGGGQPVGMVKSKNRVGSGSSSAPRMVFCPGVRVERCAT